MTAERARTGGSDPGAGPFALPFGVNLTTIGVPSAWWLDTAQALESAGVRGVWAWDHFMSRGRVPASVLECWTTLAAVAARTSRLRVGSFVTNVMTRHPAVLARMATTVHEQSGGRVELGIGIGGYARELEAYGIGMPPVRDRVERLEEAVKVLRLLWQGGPATFEGRHFRLHEAYALPVSASQPRIIVGGESAGGARLAATTGDAWTTTADGLLSYGAVYEETLASLGRRRDDVAIVVTLATASHLTPGGAPVLADLAAEAERWRELGADELVLDWVRPRDIPALLVALERQ